MQRVGRVFKWIATGSFSLILAACYGVMYSMQQVSGRVVVRAASDGAPIPGLRVTVSGATEEHLATDDAGEAAYSAETDRFGGFEVHIQDVDGPANGGEFAATTVWVAGGTDVVELDALEPTADTATLSTVAGTPTAVGTAGAVD